MKNVTCLAALAVTLALAGCGGGGSGGGNPSQRTITPEVSLSGAPASVKEDAGTHDITVTLDRDAPAGGLTLNYTEDGTAKTVTVPAGRRAATITVKITDDSTAGEEDETRVITLAAGTGYTLGSGKTFTLTITDDDTSRPTNSGGGGGGGGSPSGGSGGNVNGDKDDENNGENDQQSGANPLLGEKDRMALKDAIDGNAEASPPVAGVMKPDCGNNADCMRIVEKLESEAKKYKLLSVEQLNSEAVLNGEGDGDDETFNDAFGRSDVWATQVSTYRFLLEGAIDGLEGAAPPHTPDNDAIASAVDAAVTVRAGRFTSFVGGRNAIASDIGGPDDPWGVWIKEGDATALWYWHMEGGDPVTDRAAFFTKYANDGGNATYTGALNGYAHYTDGQGDTHAGQFGAEISLEADFGASNTDAASITGTVSGFSGAGAARAGWNEVTLNSDYTAQGATTNRGATGDASGRWTPDFVYDSDTSDTQPDSIAGRVGLTFTANTDTGALAGAAAGVFKAD